MNSQILYEDNHILIINKKVGQLVQGDKTGDQSLLELLKDFIKELRNNTDKEKIIITQNGNELYFKNGKIEKSLELNKEDILFVEIF